MTRVSELDISFGFELYLEKVVGFEKLEVRKSFVESLFKVRTSQRINQLFVREKFLDQKMNIQLPINVKVRKSFFKFLSWPSSVLALEFSLKRVRVLPSHDELICSFAQYDALALPTSLLKISRQPTDIIYCNTFDGIVILHHATVH